MKAATIKFDSRQFAFTFQSTPPVKAATSDRIWSAMSLAFQSTPPVKAATYLLCVLSVLCYISIHAAREGGDLSALSSSSLGLFISIHAAREGGDLQVPPPLLLSWYFNPRRP